MPTQLEYSGHDEPLIKLCRRLASSHQKAGVPVGEGPVVAHAIAQGFVVVGAEGYRLTKEGRVWLKKRLSEVD